MKQETELCIRRGNSQSLHNSVENKSELTNNKESSIPGDYV